MRSFSVIVVLLAAGPAFASRIPPVEPTRTLRPAGARQAPLPPALPEGTVRPRVEATEPDPSTFTGRRIDLDFRGADIHRVLRLLADAGQVTLETTDGVTGEVTIKMRNVPWEQALHIVVKAKQLSYERVGDVIRIWKHTR